MSENTVSEHKKLLGDAVADAANCLLHSAGKEWLRKEAVLRLCERIHTVCGASATEVARLEGRLTQCEAAAERREVKLVEERDRAEATLTRACVLLGGSGEWTHRTPPVSSPESGDLLRELPALAESAVATIHRCVDLLARFAELLPPRESITRDTLVLMPRATRDTQLAVEVADAIRDVRAAYPRANGGAG